MNTNLEDAVCSDPSYVQENYHDEITGGDCNIFDNEEEDTDKKTNAPVPDKPVRKSTPRQKLVVKPSEKKDCTLSNPDPATISRQFKLAR